MSFETTNSISNIKLTVHLKVAQIIRIKILTKKIATTVASGTDRHISATFRHTVSVPSRNTIKKPNIAATPAQAIRMPRIDGCVISPTYVMIGASMKPTPRPSSTAATNTMPVDCA